METQQMNLEFNNLNMLVYKVKNFEELITDPADPDKVPCWAEIWPASVGLARYLYEKRDLSGYTAIELGAGLGVPGLMAGCKGAHITFSDFNQLALDFCARNARANKLQKFETMWADWRDFPADLNYDLVLGSEIMYEPRLLPSLKEVLVSFLRNGSEMILAHPRRNLSHSFVEEVATEAGKEQNHRLEYVDVTVEDSLFNDYTIAIHLIG